MSKVKQYIQDKGVFTTWMLQEQDLIQAFAKSYAHVIISSAFQDVMNQPDIFESDLEPILHKLFHLHLLSTIEKDLAWYVEHKMIQPKNIKEVRMSICKISI